MTGSLRVVATAGPRRPRQVGADRRASPASTPTASPRRSAAGSRSISGTRGRRCPSGREVGFVDVPGHERFIRNMLAGVGPGAARAVRRRGRRGMEAAVGGAPADPRRARGRRRCDRVDEDRPRRRRRRSRSPPTRCASGSAGTALARGADRAGQRPDRATGSMTLRAALERIVAGGAGTAGRAAAPVRRPRVLDHRRRHGRDGHADRRLSARRRRRQRRARARCGRGSARCRRTSTS